MSTLHTTAHFERIHSLASDMSLMSRPDVRSAIQAAIRRLITIDNRASSGLPLPNGYPTDERFLMPDEREWAETALLTLSSTT